VIIALLFVVLMASPAVVIVRYAARPRREPALVYQAPRPRARSVEGQVVLAASAVAVDSSRSKPRLVAPLKKSKLDLINVDGEIVSDTIQRLILTR